MTYKEYRNLLREDIDRLTLSNHIKACKYYFTTASFKIIFWYRLGSYIKSKRGFLKFFYPFLFFIELHKQWRVGINLSLGTKIGGGLMFAHFSGVVIHPDVIIGRNCTIYQCVTIGSTRTHNGGGGKMHNRR
jgi:serine O-acetyltransferase